MRDIIVYIVGLACVTLPVYLATAIACDYPDPDPEYAPPIVASVYAADASDVCLDAHEHMDAGGFWCASDDGAIEPVFTLAGCAWCYLVVCHADTAPTFLRVECAGLP